MEPRPRSRGWKIAAAVLAVLLVGTLAAGAYCVSALQEDLRAMEIRLDSAERNLSFQKRETDRLREEETEYRQFARDVRRYMDQSGISQEDPLYQRAKDLGGLFYIGEIAEAQNQK